MTSARVANRNHMTSFYFRTIGCLARNPELVTSDAGIRTSYVSNQRAPVRNRRSHRGCRTTHD